MTDAQAARFVAALDRIDASLFALRHEFDAAAREAADRVTDLQAKRARQDLPASFTRASAQAQPA